MAFNRLATVWSRRFAGFFALVGVLALSACGGGSGAPNNPFAPGPTPVPALSVLPPSATVYSGTPVVLTINGGAPPYRAFSSNGTVLPVAQTIAGSSLVLLANAVSGDTAVTVTVQDSAGQTAPVTVTVKASTLLNTFAVTPNRNECGTTAICSGQTGTASIVVLGPGGAAQAGRQVRFDVVSGPFSILTNNPATPTAGSVTVTSDAAGTAQVVLQANLNAPTQPAQLRVTDLTSGQQLTSNFMIVQNTNGSSILTVVPADATITGAFVNECSAGARADYYIFGGTPPYTVTPSFPDAVSIANRIVNTAGGFFEAITNGTCVQPLTFSIVDATGRQTTATLNNQPGQAARPIVTLPALAITPGTVATPTGGCVNGATFRFAVTGGSGSYNVFFSSPATASVSSAGSNLYDVKITVPNVVGTFTVTALDVGTQSTTTATLNCQ